MKKNPRTLFLLLGLLLPFLSLGGFLWSKLHGLDDCALCIAQRWGLLGAGLGFLISLRFPILGCLGVMAASFYVIEHAYLQLVLEHGVRLEQFAYLWSLYQRVEESDKGHILPLLSPFYGLTWVFKKLPAYSLVLGCVNITISISATLRTIVNKIRRRGIHGVNDKCKYLFLICLGFGEISSCFAKDLGTQGAVFEIVEEDMIVSLHKKAQALDVKTLQSSWKRHVERWSPKNVEGIQTTQERRTFRIDPTFTVPSSWSDHEGKIFAPQGLRINPLKVLPFKGTLLFIQGDAPRQKEALSRVDDTTKVILVSGNPREFMEKTGRTVYFDQGGFLTRRLSISSVPARVTQEGDDLKVEELREDDL